MRSVLFAVFVTALLCLAFAPDRARAQSAPATNPPPTDSQWLSHQMNQPPPADNPKYAISQERVDEIVQLYLQAKKEAEAKARNQPSGNK
ncbi:MAG: hypothetical protein HY914_02445 [Desulfomonile tiedjei]|nr:hypothetical protein [Desulfomonile tiedjei]